MGRFLARAFAVIGLCFGLLLGTLIAVGASYVPNTEIPAGFAGKHVFVNGTPIRVLQRGQGRDVLLIHGSPGSIEDWEPVLNALQSELRLTAFDRPGNGFSGDTGAYSLADNAEVALSLIEQLKLHDVTVVGHSYGGATALALALLASPLVKSYVIVDSASYTSSRQPTPIYRLLNVPRLGIGFASVFGSRVAPAKIRQGLLEQWSGGPPSEAFIALRTQLWSSPKVAHAVAEETLGAPEFLQAQSSRYHEIHAPVQILAQADNVFRRETANHLHQDIANSTLHLLSGTGHYLQFQKTEDVVAAIRVAAAN